MDSFGRIAEILVTIVLLFVVPVIIYAGISESNRNMYITTQTRMFADKVRNQGYISSGMYEEYIGSLSEDTVYDIKLIHSVRAYDEEGNCFYIDHYNSDILQNIYEEDYHMYAGDYFMVEIREASGGLFSRLLQRLLPAGDIKQTPIRYGGIVRDETE